MDSESLKAFLEIADTRSFTRAAANLHLSQPAVSKRLKSLEQRIGQPLFHRIGRKVQLSEAGRALLPYAQRVLQDMEDARRALSKLREKVSGRLSIGTSHHIGLHRLPPVLKRYTQLYPEVDLDLHFMDSEDVCEAVIAGKLELGIVTLPTRSLPQLRTGRVWIDPLCVVAAPNHALAKSKRVRLEVLARYPAVLPDADTYTHRIVLAELERRGVQPHVRLATNYLETLKMLASIGLGWSVLPQSMLDDSVKVLPVAGFHPQRHLGWVRHAARTLSAPASALLTELDMVAESASPVS